MIAFEHGHESESLCSCRSCWTSVSVIFDTVITSICGFRRTIKEMIYIDTKLKMIYSSILKCDKCLFVPMSIFAFVCKKIVVRQRFDSLIFMKITE